MSVGKRARIESGDGDHKVTKTNSDPDGYFMSYSHVDVHLTMLEDRRRTSAYRLAILKACDQLYKKVAVDVGSGTGILSCFLCQAGVSRVYAIEASDSAKIADSVFRANQIEGQVTLINSTAETAALPEQVDAVVSEWMGYCLFYENMLPSVLDIRDRFLKKGGLMFPNSASLFIAGFTKSSPVTDTDTESEDEGLDPSLDKLYSCDLGPVREAFRLQCLSRASVTWVNDVTKFITKPCCVFKLCLDSISKQSLLEGLTGSFSLESFGEVTLDAFCLWFDVGFPSGINLSTSPYESPTHWQQTLVFIDKPVALTQKSIVKGHVTLMTHERRDLSIDISFSMQNDSGTEQAFTKTAFLSYSSC